ncbi:MAG: TetR/AcrR family transcriptional regulator [Sandaracinaceae bacterium]|nr:TetR/AcrR family transcriptional regulator [Sandaracinaceae bacterium]
MSAKDRILACARDIYLAEGLSGLSLRAVARCAGITAPAIYRHFDDKEDLLWAVCQRGHELFASYLARGLKGATPRERLVATGMGYLDFALEHRPYYVIMFVAPPEHFGLERLAERSADEGGATFQMLVDRVRECVDAGVLSRADPVAHAVVIWGHVHGLVTIEQRLPRDPEARRLLAPPPIATDEQFRALYRRSIEALLDGLAPR